MYYLFLVLTLFLVNCSSLQVVPEPTLDLISVKSKSYCPTWNWHPFCVETKPNSFYFRGVYQNSIGEKRYYIDYYIDSFDTDLPVGISLKVDGTYYILKKTLTDYSEALKLRSELPDDLIKLIGSTKENISLSYSNRKSTINFDFSNSETETIKNNLKTTIETVNNIQKLKIIK
jgi:hypothetical protein